VERALAVTASIGRKERRRGCTELPHNLWFEPGYRLPLSPRMGLGAECTEPAPQCIVQSGYRLPAVPKHLSPTLSDVAQAAGVSTATASRALSGKRAVNPRLVRAVRVASERLDYRMNEVARSLRQQRTQTVGMLVPRIANPFFLGIVEAAERALHAAGHELFLCDSQDDPAVEATRVRALVARRVDGLLVIPCDTSASTQTIKTAGSQVPLVQLDRYVDGVDADYVGIDSEAGIRSALDHLASTGARRVVFISAAASNTAAAERLEAYRRLARDRFDSPSAESCLLGDFSLAWGRSAVAQLRVDGLPDALACGNDLIGLGALQELRSMGVKVPRQVRVLGFDDIGFAALSDPPLTTVRQPAEAIGREGARLLLGRLSADAPAPARLVRLMPSLVVRESTQAAATR
jgi:LacI family transcriptional regulator